jgi:3-oxoadipate enol-lactonase
MMGGMTATMIEVDGGTVWADDSGGDGPTLVLLHPGVGDSTIWDPVLPALAAKYRVIRYDARGFGHSPAPTATFSLLRDLLTVLGHYDVKRAAIVGCSQGGGTALGLALEQPERVPALVLLCPGIPGIPLDDDSDEAAVLGAEWERAEAAGDVDALASVTQRVWGRAGATPEAMEQFRSSARAVLSTGDLEQEDPPVYDRLTEIAVPTSLLVGDADRGRQGRRRPHPRLRAHPRPGDGPPAAAARPGPGTADDHEHARPRLLVSAFRSILIRSGCPRPGWNRR